MSPRAGHLLAASLLVGAVWSMFSGCHSFQSDKTNCVLNSGACEGDGDCCGGACGDGACNGCYPAGYYCETNTDCCTSLCDETNTCVTCVPGNACASDLDCCDGYLCDVRVHACASCTPGKTCSSDADCFCGPCDPVYKVCD